jgi:tetratricopeptide (TPR) repeat protein
MEQARQETARRHWAIPAALVALTLGVYGRALGHTFLLNWDDLTYVLENPAIRGLDLEHLRLVFGGPYFGNYAPLHLLSYSLDQAIWGLEPAGFVATNLALHAANGVLFFGLLVRLGLSPAAAGFGAGIFLVHPVQVESVVWISERKNLLAMFFSLAGVRAYLSFRSREGMRRWVPYMGSLAAISAALLSKAAAVVVPPLLLLLDVGHVPTERRRGALLDKVPFAFAATGLALATVASQREMIEEGRSAFAMDGLTTFFTMTPIVVRYLAMLAWPAALSALYTPEIRTAPDPTFVASAILLLVLAGLGVWIWFRARRLFAPYAFFFVALVPVLQLVPLPTLVNDRYLYFPMLGACALAGIAIEAALARPRLGRVVSAAGAAVVFALGATSFARTDVWRDDLTLWTDVAEKAPGSALAWTGLATSLADRGRVAEAVPAFHRALALDPVHPLALNGLGAAYNSLGQFEVARPLLLRATELPGDPFPAYMNLGTGYLATGDPAGAERAFEAALAVRPGASDALDALARARAAR